MTDSPVLRLVDAAFTHPGGAGVGGLRARHRARRGRRAHRTERRRQVDAAEGHPRPRAAHRGNARDRRRHPVTRSAHARHGMVWFLPQSADLDPDFPISLEQVVMQGRYRGLGLLRWPGRADRAAVRRRARVGRPRVASRRARSANCRAASGSAGSSRGPSPPSRACCCSTSRSTASTSRTATPSSTRSASLKRDGVAVLVSTHDLELARLVCDSVAAREPHAADLRTGRRGAHARQHPGVLRGRRGRDRRAHARRARPRGPLMPSSAYAETAWGSAIGCP